MDTDSSVPIRVNLWLKKVRPVFCLGLHAELLVRQLGRDAALRGALEVTFLNQERLVDFLDGVRFFAHRHGEGIHADRPTAELVHERFQNALVHLVEAVLVDLQHRQRLVGDVGGDPFRTLALTCA